MKVRDIVVAVAILLVVLILGAGCGYQYVPDIYRCFRRGGEWVEVHRKDGTALRSCRPIKYNSAASQTTKGRHDA